MGATNTNTLGTKLPQISSLAFPGWSRSLYIDQSCASKERESAQVGIKKLMFTLEAHLYPTSILHDNATCHLLGF